MFDPTPQTIKSDASPKPSTVNVAELLAFADFVENRDYPFFSMASWHTCLANEYAEWKGIAYPVLGEAREVYPIMGRAFGLTKEQFMTLCCYSDDYREFRYSRAHAAKRLREMAATGTTSLMTGHPMHKLVAHLD